MAIDLESIKKITQIVQSLVTTSALIVGGIWTYLLFIRKRQALPRANIKHKVTAIELIQGKIFLVHVAISIANQGDVLIRLSEGEIRLQKVSPLAPELQKTIKDNSLPRTQNSELEFPFPLIERKEIQADVRIEPNESDEIYFDFVIKSDVKAVKIYSHFTNKKMYNKSTPIGWRLTTFYDLNNSIKAKEA
jgi:hypothetical protein